MHNSFIGHSGALFFVAYDFDDDAIIAFMHEGKTRCWVITPAGDSSQVEF